MQIVRSMRGQGYSWRVLSHGVHMYVPVEVQHGKLANNNQANKMIKKMDGLDIFREIYRGSE